MRAVARFRPHRTGGVRLECDGTLGSGERTKYIIHNYGHSGAGITLSWGCAGAVVDMVEARIAQMGGLEPSIAVLGSGVIGLTVASELRHKRAGLKIKIYTDSLDIAKTTSFIAGGQFEPSGIFSEYLEGDHPSAKTCALYDLIRRSDERIRAIVAAGEAEKFGIARRANYTFDTGKSHGFDYGIPHSVVGKPKEIPLPFEKIKRPGREYSTWLLNPTIMLPALIADLAGKNVERVSKVFRSRADIERLDENIIINCTGLGSKALFHDDRLQPIKGQLVILKNPQQLDYFFSGGCGNTTAYMFARQDDIVLGGTYEHDVKDADEEKTDKAKHIFEFMKNIFNGQTSDCKDYDAPEWPLKYEQPDCADRKYVCGASAR